MNVTSIAPDRIEIGRIIGAGIDHWLMCVIEGDDGENCYAEQYPDRVSAVAAAETWEMPIRFVNDPGSVSVVLEVVNG